MYLSTKMNQPGRITNLIFFPSKQISHDFPWRRTPHALIENIDRWDKTLRLIDSKC